MALAVENNRENNGGTLVALSTQGEHLGYLAYAIKKNAVCIDSIGVRPEARRKGIATAMLAALQEEFPVIPVRVGYTTPDGEAWAQSVKDMLCDR